MSDNSGGIFISGFLLGVIMCLFVGVNYWSKDLHEVCSDIKNWEHPTCMSIATNDQKSLRKIILNKESHDRQP